MITHVGHVITKQTLENTDFPTQSATGIDSIERLYTPGSSKGTTHTNFYGYIPAELHRNESISYGEGGLLNECYHRKFRREQTGSTGRSVLYNALSAPDYLTDPAEIEEIEPSGLGMSAALLRSIYLDDFNLEFPLRNVINSDDGFVEAILAHESHEAFAARNVNRLSPKNRDISEVSLINFFIEWKELKFLVRNLAKNRGQARRFIASLTTREIFWDELLDLVAQLRLEWAYGFGAFLRDLKKIIELIVHMPDKVEGFIAASKRRHVASYQEVIPIGDPADMSSLLHRVLETKYLTMCQTIYSSSVVRTLNMYYHYSCPDLSNMRGRTLVMLEKLGIRRDPSIIWDSIPVSFLIDQFIDIGGWLQKMTKRNFEFEVVLDGFSSSLKGGVACYVDGQFSSFADKAYNSYTAFRIEECQCSVYNRVEVNPPLPTGPKIVRMLNMQQIVNDLALIVVNRKSKWSKL